MILRKKSLKTDGFLYNLAIAPKINLILKVWKKSHGKPILSKAFKEINSSVEFLIGFHTSIHHFTKS